MSSVPDGRAANQPPSLTTLIPPSAAPLPGALSSTRVILSPANWVLRTCSGESWLRAFFCSGVAGEAKRTVEQAAGKPLEADRHFQQGPPEARTDPIDHGAADQGLAHRRAGAPLRAMLEQVIDGHAEKVVGRQQADTGRDYAVAVVIGVAGKGDVIAILEADQPLHGMAGRGIHADLAIPVQAHEGELRVDDLADHLQIEPVALGDARPVMHARATQRIDAQAQAGC